MKAAVLFIGFIGLCTGRTSHNDQQGRSGIDVKAIPAADGRLNLYELPIGQGDGHVIQCPNGDLSIFDLGSTSNRADNFWKEDEILEFFGSQKANIKNVLITHNHFDHYSLLPRAFTTPDSLPGLVNIYISCTGDDLPVTLERWVDEDIQARDKLRPINGGNACGPNGETCDNVNLCPGDSKIIFKVMAANLGQNCLAGNKNVDSLVVKVTYSQFSILLSGDFEDEETDIDGVQKQMVDFYGRELEVMVYKLSHHGASFLANKPVWTDAMKPKAILATGNGDHSYRHPRCLVIDALMNGLCNPLAGDPALDTFCSHPINTQPRDRLQEDYLCGISSSEPIEQRKNADRAIYTTVPTGEDSSPRMNQISIKTDGTRWEIKNAITGRSPDPIRTADVTAEDDIASAFVAKD